jgi:hypothetical protein
VEISAFYAIDMCHMIVLVISQHMILQFQYLITLRIYCLVLRHLLLPPFDQSDAVEERHDCNVDAWVLEQALIEFAERLSTGLPKGAHYTVEVRVEIVTDCKAAGEDCLEVSVLCFRKMREKATVIAENDPIWREKSIVKNLVYVGGVANFVGIKKDQVKITMQCWEA